MKKIIALCWVALISLASFAQNPQAWKALEKPLNFFMANDLGRNGYYDQKPIAELMGNGRKCGYRVCGSCRRRTSL